MALIKINWNPEPKELRVFLALLPLFALLVGSMLFYRFELPQVAGLVLATGVGLAVLGLVSSQVARCTYIAMVCLSFPIGFVVSHVAMLVIYFMVLTPIGLCLRVFGYDPMDRKIDASAESYWQVRDPEKKSPGYFRQF